MLQPPVPRPSYRGPEPHKKLYSTAHIVVAAVVVLAPCAHVAAFPSKPHLEHNHSQCVASLTAQPITAQYSNPKHTFALQRIQLAHHSRVAGAFVCACVCMWQLVCVTSVRAAGVMDGYRFVYPSISPPSVASSALSAHLRACPTHTHTHLHTHTRTHARMHLSRPLFSVCL